MAPRPFWVTARAPKSMEFRTLPSPQSCLPQASTEDYGGVSLCAVSYFVAFIMLRSGFATPQQRGLREVRYQHSELTACSTRKTIFPFSPLAVPRDMFLIEVQRAKMPTQKRKQRRRKTDCLLLLLMLGLLWMKMPILIAGITRIYGVGRRPQMQCFRQNVSNSSSYGFIYWSANRFIYRCLLVCSWQSIDQSSPYHSPLTGLDMSIILIVRNTTCPYDEYTSAR